MTDKEIAQKLEMAKYLGGDRCRTEVNFGHEWSAASCARASVHIIHHIINSINWED